MFQCCIVQIHYFIILNSQIKFCLMKWVFQHFRLSSHNWCDKIFQHLKFNISITICIYFLTCFSVNNVKSRHCKNHPDVFFFYICGQFIVEVQKCTITPRRFTSYTFDSHLRDWIKLWVPHFICSVFSNGLCDWFNNNKSMSFAIPMI